MTDLSDRLTAGMSARKRIALVAHDHKKPDLVEWANNHLAALQPHKLYATGTAGRVLREAPNLDVTRLQSGPLEGDFFMASPLISSGYVRRQDDYHVYRTRLVYRNKPT